MCWAVDGLRRSGVVDTVVVVAPPDGVEILRAALGDRRAGVVVTPGADDRVGSVDAGLTALDSVASSVTTVLVHDAARCLCPPETIRAVTAAVRAGAPAVIPALPASDTLKRADPDGRVTATIDRRGLVGVQTPQGFAVDVLRRAHDHARERRARGLDVPATDDAGLVEDLGETVVTAPGHPRAFKITTAADLALAESIVAGRQPDGDRCGMKVDDS